MRERECLLLYFIKNQFFVKNGVSVKEAGVQCLLLSYSVLVELNFATFLKSTNNTKDFFLKVSRDL